MSIRTNGHARPLMSWQDLPSDDVRRQFTYIWPDFDSPDYSQDTAYTTRFFEYRGDFYDVQDFVQIESDVNPPGMRAPFSHTVPRGHELTHWEGIATDSMNTGVVVRFATDWDGLPDYDAVVVGYYVAEAE